MRKTYDKDNMRVALIPYAPMSLWKLEAGIYPVMEQQPFLFYERQASALE